MRRMSVITMVLLSAAFLAVTTAAQVQVDWETLYTGEGANIDWPVGIGVDNAGNFYVAGRSYSSATDWDVVVAKYNDGIIEWERRYDGGHDSADYAYAMAVSGDGHVYVSGWTARKGVMLQDFLTIAYEPDGDTLWTRVLDRGALDFPRHMIILSDGSILIAGKGFHPVSFALIKYTPAGDTVWTARYAWTGATDHNGHRVACDSSGNFIVTGYARIDSRGDALTVKFSPDGDTLWGRIYSGGESLGAEARAVGADRDGNVYVAVKTISSGEDPDIVILKYSPDGTLLWERIYDGPADLTDQPWDMIVDGASNICVVGSSPGGASNTDVVILKYTAAGDTLWQTRAAAEGSIFEEPTAMARDAAGDFYVVGRRTSASCGDDYLVMKFNGTTGALAWQTTYDENCATNRGLCIAVSGEDNVCVTGTSDPAGDPDGGIDIRTVKYKPIPSAVFEPQTVQMPSSFALWQNVPNPFNASTLIGFDLETGGTVTLRVYNILGQCVLVHREPGLPPGSYSYVWDGRDQAGRELPSGIYLYRLTTERFAQTRKMTLLR